MSDKNANQKDQGDVLDGDETIAPAKKKLSGKALVLFMILPALLLVVGGGSATMMLMGGDKAEASSPKDGSEKTSAKDGKKESPALEDSTPESENKASGATSGGHSSVRSASPSSSNGAEIQIGEPGNPSFYTMPKLLVTVSNGSGRSSQLLLKLTFEASDPAVFNKVDSVLPRVTDQFQMFLREMRVDDLSGSAGDYRIRRELLRRVNLSLYPDSVDAVLIEEFIVQ